MALPLINTLGMKVSAAEASGTGYNIMPIWTKRLDAKTHVTTPNSDLIYGMTFVDLSKTGPLVSSRKEDILKNEDGSIDIYFGPTSPKGHESNWVQTSRQGMVCVFPVLRATQAFFDKSWSLPDVKKVKQ